MPIHCRYSFVVVVAALLTWFVQTERVRACSGDEIPKCLSQVCDAEDGRLPVTVHIDSALRGRIGVMLKRSPTFRTQCRRVAATPRLYIRVHVNGVLPDQRFRARTRILKFKSGVIIAEVELRTPWAPDEWIAHEFEHVLEQIDGVRIAELADKTGSVWRTSGDTFESERAIRAGRTVVEEVRRPHRGTADGFVE